jgi:hypothetical protein
MIMDVDAEGKPAQIRILRNPLVSNEEPIRQCVAEWRIPSARGKTTALIQWAWSCKDISISSSAGLKSYPCFPPESHHQD